MNRNLIQGSAGGVKMGRGINMSSPGANQVIAVHEEAVLRDFRNNVNLFIWIARIMGLTWMKGMGEIDDLHASRIKANMSKKKPRPIPVPAQFIPQLIDAHTHLASCGGDTAELLKRAHEAGVEKLCTVGDGLAEAELALQAAQEFNNVYAACAIHPTKADQLDAAARQRLSEMAQDPACVAIGETGLDTYWITHDPENTASLEVQEEALRWHIDLAVNSGKALMIHNREADADLMRVLGSAPRPENTILHCFSSPLGVAKEALERGYILSFAGNVTFKRNEELREAARIAPLEQIFIETDAPYMTPEPFRGSRNEPSLIGHTALCIAEVRGMAVEELAVALSANFDRGYHS